MESSVQHKSKKNIPKSSFLDTAEENNVNTSLDTAPLAKSTLQTLQAAKESIVHFLNPPKRSNSVNRPKNFFARKFEHFRQSSHLKEVNSQNKPNKVNKIATTVRHRSVNADNRQSILTTLSCNNNEAVHPCNKILLFSFSNVRNKHKLSQFYLLASPLSPNSDETCSFFSSPHYYHTLNSFNDLQNHLHKNSNTNTNNNCNKNICSGLVEYYGNLHQNSSQKLTVDGKETCPQKKRTATDIKDLPNGEDHLTTKNYHSFTDNSTRNFFNFILRIILI